MKKIIIAFILFISVFCSAEVFADSDAITVTVNGKILETPIPARLVNDRTMLPMRAVFEALGANVTWVGEDSLIFAAKGNILITLKIGEPNIVVQTTEDTGNTVIALDAAPFIDGDYTLVPVRAAAEGLNADVEWIDETNTVMINSK